MNRAPTRSILCGVFLLGIVGAEAAAALAIAAEPQRSQLEVTAKSGRLSVRAHEAPLAAVLETVGREAGVRMVFRGGLETPITARFADLPIDEGVRRLSRFHSVVLIYDALPGKTESPVLTEIWVTESSGGRDRTEQAPRAVRPDTDSRAEARPLVAPQGWTQDLAAALKHVSPESRTPRIEVLVRQQGVHAVVDALRKTVIGDPAPAVKRAAIQVLASMKDPGAEDALRAALENPHPGVRWEAQKALAQQSRARASEGSVE